MKEDEVPYYEFYYSFEKSKEFKSLNDIILDCK